LSVPLPLVPEPLPMVSHAALEVVFHAQPAPAVTVVEPLPPDVPTLALVGESAYVQPADWLKVTVRPATVRLPVRSGPVLAVTEYVTVPLPEPLAPAVMLAHDAPLVAVHGQPAVVVTLTEAVVAPAPYDALVGETVYAQPAAWLTTKGTPPTVIDALRAGPVFAAAT
jgi:hypothetical protein